MRKLRPAKGVGRLRGAGRSPLRWVPGFSSLGEEVAPAAEGDPAPWGHRAFRRQAGLYLTGCGPPRPCGVQDPGVGFLDLGTGRQRTQGDARRPAGRLSPLPRPQVDLYGFGADGKGNWHHYWENNPSAGAFRKTGVHDGDFESNVTATLASIDKIRIFKGR